MLSSAIFPVVVFFSILITESIVVCFPRRSSAPRCQTVAIFRLNHRPIHRKLCRRARLHQNKRWFDLIINANPHLRPGNYQTVSIGAYWLTLVHVVGPTVLYPTVSYRTLAGCLRRVSHRLSPSSNPSRVVRSKIRKWTESRHRQGRLRC